MEQKCKITTSGTAQRIIIDTAEQEQYNMGALKKKKELPILDLKINMQLHAAKTKKQHSTIQKSIYGRKSTHGTNYYEEYHLKYVLLKLQPGRKYYTSIL